MKKMKLLSFALSGILAVSSMCGITASASNLYEIPESITSIKELEDFITSPVEISAKDYVRLCNQMTEEELEEFFKSLGALDSEAELNVDSYYDGMKEVAESDCTFTIYPDGITYPEGIDPGYILPSDIPQTPLGVQVVEYLTETSGTFESGVTYYYNEETKGLIFDGKGTLSNEDWATARRSFDHEFMFFGNDVSIADYSNGTTYSPIINQTRIIDGRVSTPIYTYKKNTNFSDVYEEHLNFVCRNAEDIDAAVDNAKQNRYIYYTVADDVDPYTFVCPLEPAPEEIYAEGKLVSKKESETGGFVFWSFDGTTESGEFFVSSSRNTSYTIEQAFEIAKNYSVTEVCLMDTPEGFETIEEAEAELLRIINEAKAVETTEVTAPTEVTEPTEAVEEKTAETIAESVEILADEITEDKTEITLGDVNGNGKADVRDVSFIAREIAGGKAADLPDSADYNKDGVKNIRDAATLAKELA